MSQPVEQRPERRPGERAMEGWLRQWLGDAMVAQPAMLESEAISTSPQEETMSVCYWRRSVGEWLVMWFCCNDRLKGVELRCNECVWMVPGTYAG